MVAGTEGAQGREGGSGRRKPRLRKQQIEEGGEDAGQGREGGGGARRQKGRKQQEEGQESGGTEGAQQQEGARRQKGRKQEEGESAAGGPTEGATGGRQRRDRASGGVGVTLDSISSQSLHERPGLERRVAAGVGADGTREECSNE